MSNDDRVPTISAFQLKYDEGTGEYTIFVGIKEGNPRVSTSFPEKTR